LGEDQLVKVENGEPVEHLGEWDFHTKPVQGDHIDLIHAGRVDYYEVVGYRHTAFGIESVKQAPNSMAAENRPPKMLVQYMRSSYDPVIET
jgi:hypothetical protein|tara:strand:- start:245 stop:517 length:273 start_codon:yes stop_codon:yes gene_type:complete